MRELPPVLSGDALQQIASLRDYLVRAARGSESETLETVTAHASGILKQTGRAGGAAALPAGENQASDVLQREARLRALIVKSAEESRERDSVLLSSIGDLGYEMRQQYLARSEFGEYQLDALKALAKDAVHKAEVRRGFLEDPDTHQTVLDIAISQQLQFTGQELTDGGWVYYELSPGQTLGLYTSTGWQFWVNGRKVGWFDSADGMLHTVSQVVEQEIRMGDWRMSAVGGFGLKYMGGG